MGGYTGVFKWVFLNILQISPENTYVGSLFNRAAGLKTFIKKRLTQVLSCEICKTSKNIFVYKTRLFFYRTHLEHLCLCQNCHCGLWNIWQSHSKVLSLSCDLQNLTGTISVPPCLFVDFKSSWSFLIPIR